MSDRTLQQRISGLFGGSDRAPVEPGIHHFEDLTGDVVTRFHLRVDPDGGGLLIANAAEAAHLSNVGVLMAHGILSGRSDDGVRQDIRARFHDVSEETVGADLAQMHSIIEAMASPSDNYPVSNFADPEMTGWTRELAAPMQADIDQCDPVTARRMLLKLWEAGVPHVTFVVHPEGDTGQLPPLVEAAGDVGLISGLRGVASWMGESTIRDAAEAGLDHLDLLCVSMDGCVHDTMAGEGDYERMQQCLKECREMEFASVAFVPVFQENVSELHEMIVKGPESGIRNMSFYAMACPDGDTTSQQAGALAAHELHQVAATIEDATVEVDGRFLWIPPVRFDPSEPLAPQIRRAPRTSGDMCIRITADGDVLPPRGPRRPAGNILQDPWETIWSDDAFSRYRERLEAPIQCPDCRDLPICAADCPADPDGWSDPKEAGGEQ
ncbi:MAG: SPASM domain-containing protein [Armatimonadota bacterium]